MISKGTINPLNTVAVSNSTSNGNRKAIIKNCVPFTDCRSETNNTQIDNAKGIDVVTPMYNLIECNNNYSKTSGRL